MRISYDRLKASLCAGAPTLILTHRRPDGDTLGSAAALALWLRRMGAEAYLFPNPEVTARFLPYVKGLFAPEGWTAGRVISVDVADASLIPSGAPDDVDLAIDHHAIHRDFAAETYVEPSASSCGQIVGRVIEDCRGLELREAEAVYVAVASDTGCFRYDNTNPETLRLAARCLETGVHAEKINFQLFRLKTRGRARLESFLYANARFIHGGDGAVAALTLADLQAVSCTDDDQANLASLLCEIDGVRAGVLLTETGHGSWKVSARGRAGCDMARLCQRFGGGGHTAAAGCTLDGVSLEEAEALLSSALEEELEETNGL